MTSAASITDEASAIELAGGKPLLVECAADNIKITVPGDLALAETILASQTRETI
jgi:2-C-methyl-D-erythritol 4-phosphate cytidylyltransferase